ncbi:NUDIX domain-containing protein, partial [Acinetobacter baumannii]
MTIQTEQEFLASYDRRDYDAPLLTVDMAIFSVFNGQLQVLLIKRPNFPAKDQWALPGGFADLKHDQDLMATAYRKLVEKTGISSPYLEQVASVGNAKRDPRGWAVTILYFALIDFNAYQHQALAEYSEWIPVAKAQDLALAFDHNELLSLA